MLKTMLKQGDPLRKVHSNYAGLRILLKSAWVVGIQLSVITVVCQQ